MRGICKEEDYAFLGGVKMPDEDEDYEGGEECFSAQAQRYREKERRWRRHVAELSSSQEADVRERLSRLRSFRVFQRRVLMEGCGMEPSTAGLLMDQRLSRI
ncbi:unnamed protein product [Arctogadus glacialis]